MRRFQVTIGVLAGLLTGLSVTAITYLGSQIAGLPFVAFDLFEFVTRMLPGPVIATVIGLMVQVITALHVGALDQTAKLAEQAMAILLFLVVAALFGGVVAAIVRRTRFKRPILVALAAAAVLYVVALLYEAWLGFPAAGAVASVVWLAFVFAVWGLALGWLEQMAVPETADQTSQVNWTRRSILYLGGAAAVAALSSAVGLGAALSRSEPETEAAPALAGSTPASSAVTTATPASASVPATASVTGTPGQPSAQASVDPAPGTRPELTANKDFYRIDIDLLPPKVDAATWKLPLTGLVEKPMTLTLDQIRARPAVSQYVTLECISNLLGGELISTARFTGTRLKDLLLEAGLKPGAKELAIQAADGFYESVYQEDMLDERTLLVYEMNGEPLSQDHGFPLRIYIPNRYGMKQPKWMTSMEVLDHAGPGYWVDRGWSAQATVQTTSVIDPDTTKTADPQTGAMAFGGIAYAGARGISKVEVQVDNGPWMTARLHTPPLGPLTWVEWRYDWPAQKGEHTLAVRAYDGQGVMQDVQSHIDFPNGATGIFSWAFRV